MDLVERIIVNALHTVIDDRSRKNVADISKGIQDLNQITRSGGFSIFLNFFREQLDAKFNQFFRTEPRRLKLRDFKGCLLYTSDAADE